MKMCSIASGSSGNCIYAGTDNCHLLIDAGISGKRIEAGLNEIGLKTGEMQGVLVTHEHSDHIKSLGVLARKYGLPMYATQGTVDWIKQRQAIGKVDESLFRIVHPEETFTIGDMQIQAIPTSHDAAEPVAYLMRQGEKTMGVITDLGKYDDYIVDKLQGLDVLLLEANHDVHMLQVGAYPYQLKQRILGDRGHLSNELSGQLLGRILHDKFQKVILGHLSQENNYPQLAYETVRLEVTMGENPYKGSDFPIVVAKRNDVSELVSI
jgi:phosphoribosyl 1,2-cyclic phosphodiesterase